MRKQLLCLIVVALFSPSVLAAEPAKDAKRSVLEVEVLPQIKDQPFPEFMKALRETIPGLATPTERPFPGIVPYAPERTTVSLITRTTKPLPQVLRLPRKQFEQKVKEYEALLEKEGSASWIVKDGNVLYSLEPKKPTAVKDILEVVASMTSLLVVVDGNTVKLLRYTDLPLDLDAVAADCGLPKPEAPQNLVAFLREAITARAGANSGGVSGRIATREGKSYTPEELATKGGAQPGDRIEFNRQEPSPAAKDQNGLLKASLAALKAHAEKDALRAWLLCIMTAELRGNSSKGLSPRAQGAIVAAAREVLEIIDSPAAKKGQRELEEVLKGFAVNVQLDGLLFAAGTLSEDYGEAAKLAGRAARMHADADVGCEVYYDTYYFILSGARHTGKAQFAALVEKAAQEELARRSKGQEALIAAYENWQRRGKKDDPCPACGNPKEQHDECSPMLYLASAHYRMAQAYRGTGKFAEALPHFEKAMKFAPRTGGCSDCVVLGGEDPHKVFNPGSIEKTRSARMETMADAGKLDEAITEMRNQLAEYSGSSPCFESAIATT